MKSFDCKACAVGARQSTSLSQFFKQWMRRGKEETAADTVTSHRMEMARVPTPDSTWNYMVTFSLADGKEVELHTLEVQYKELTEGMTGTLTWEGENFLSFVRKV